jgi:hypothetical protein
MTVDTKLICLVGFLFCSSWYAISRVSGGGGEMEMGVLHRSNILNYKIQGPSECMAGSLFSADSCIRRKQLGESCDLSIYRCFEGHNLQCSQRSGKCECQNGYTASNNREGCLLQHEPSPIWSILKTIMITAVVLVHVCYFAGF